MADPISVQLEKAVVDELNEGTFSKRFTAERGYLPIFDLGEMKDLHVTVVKASKVRTINSKAWDQGDFGIYVSVQKRICPDRKNCVDKLDQEKIDGLVLLTEEIEDHLFGHTLVIGGRNYGCIGTDNDPIYSPSHLEELMQFTSVLTLTFRTHLPRS